MSKSIKLSSAVKYSNKRINIDEISFEDFVSTDNLLQNKLGKTNAIKLPTLKGLMPEYNKENILVGNIRPYLRKIWFADKQSGCSADVLVFEVNKSNHPKFIYYTLFRDDFFEHMMKGSKGTKMPRGDKKQILDFLIPDFEYNDQKKIAKVLSDLDAKIELNNKINTELEAMAKTLYDYWFVQFDFPDLNGKPYKTSGGKMIWNEKLKREIPEGWEVLPLFEGMQVQYGFPFDTNQFTDDITQKPIIRIRDILENTISTYSSQEVDEKYRLNCGDLLIGMDGNFHLNFWDKDGAYLNQRSVRIRSKNNLEVSNFQALFQLTPHIKAREKNVSRTTVGHLSDKDLKRLFVINARKNKNFDPKKTFDSMLSKIISNRLQNQELASLRDWLLPMLMNGQVTVSDVEKKLAIVTEPIEINKRTNEKVIEKVKKTKTVTIKLNPADVYKRTLLAAEIVFQLKDTYTLGHLKLQKMLYLCQEIENMALPMNFLKQAMGPYDNQLARSLDKQFVEKKWFKYQRDELLKFKPLENCGKHQDDFNKYFENQLDGINYLIKKFTLFTSTQIEAVATLYACWKEAIENKELINDKLIITKFYNWSKEKEKFKEENLVKALDWMRKNGIEPKQ